MKNAIQIKVDAQSWIELRKIIVQLINPHIINDEEITNPDASRYLLRIINEFIKLHRIKKPETELTKTNFTKEY